MSRTVKKGMWIRRKEWIESENEFYEEVEKYGYFPLYRNNRKFTDYKEYVVWQRHRWTNGSVGTEIGEPCSKCPKGYSWKECWGAGRKRDAKREVSRIWRHRGKKEIRDTLREILEDFEEDF